MSISGWSSTVTTLTCTEHAVSPDAVVRTDIHCSNVYKIKCSSPYRKQIICLSKFWVISGFIDNLGPNNYLKTTFIVPEEYMEEN